MYNNTPEAWRWSNRSVALIEMPAIATNVAGTACRWEKSRNYFVRPLATHPARASTKEDRFIAIGTTRERRNILVVFTLRRRNGKTLIRPISARYMHRREVRHYETASKT